jgi:hypothetical protein
MFKDALHPPKTAACENRRLQGAGLFWDVGNSRRQAYRRLGRPRAPLKTQDDHASRKRNDGYFLNPRNRSQHISS